MVEELISKAYLHYSSEDWAPVDRKDCANWAWMALESHDGEFDPRKRKIVDAEPHFNIPIEREWANYKYEMEDGELIAEGQLGIKGTIDLITEVDDGIIEIIDWKTGQRYDWAKGKEKTYKDLQRDFQLLLYYYAARHLYPDAHTIIITIVFVRDGGPFTMCFDDEEIAHTEALIENRFEEIQHCLYPEMVDPTQRDFRCSKICDYYKMPAPNGKGNFCKFINEQVYEIGIDKVVQQYKNPDFHIDTYNAPGE